MRSFFASCTLVVGVAAFTSGCNSNVEPYKPAPSWTGAKPSLPAAPQVNVTIKSGDAYTIAGASHQLRSRLHEKDVRGKEITITGYIVKSNITDAPECAIHKTGVKDPDGCTSEIPSFWIADTPDGKNGSIRVLGWATNFANVYDAMVKYKGLKEAPKELVKDKMLNNDIPYPLPAVGAQVKVTGVYSFAYSTSTGLVTDPVNGTLTFKKIEYVKPASEPATFKNKKM
jgi:hypothetical protein